MSTILFTPFYRAHGVRRLQSMFSPITKPLTQLPANSVLHYASNDKDHLELDTSKLYLGNNLRHAVIGFEQKLTSEEGGPRFHAVVIRDTIRDFLRNNRKFRHVENPISQVSDQNTLIVYNYSYLHALYKYAPFPLNSYNEWFNINRTVFDKINAIAKTSDKNHFVFCDVPQDIPSLSLLNVYEDTVNTNLLKIFNTPSELLLLHVHKWLTREDHEKIDPNDLGVVNSDHKSIFSGLERVSLPKINLVFSNREGNSVVLNLGYLNSWIKGEHNQTEFSTVEQLTPVQLQKVFLKFLMSARSLEQEPLATVEEEAPVENADLDPDEADDIDDLDETSPGPLSVTNKVPVVNNVVASLNDKDIDTNVVSSDDIQTQLDSLDKDIETLDVINKRKLSDRGLHVEKTGEIREEATVAPEVALHDIQKKVFTVDDVETALRAQVEQQVDYGLLSASDYRNFNRDIEAFKTSKDPYGSGQTIQQAKDIAPEVLQLDEEKTKIVSSDVVIDKSMLQSTLQSFDNDYITKVLKKDMLSMVYELQRSGVVIRKHDIQTEHSALGSYESHSLEFKPVDGQASTVRFKIPVINEDGTFTANGNKTVMRKQRVDVPIRKIKPTEVALTSYYGKTFVKLNPKKSNSSLEWIIKELNIAGMSGEGFIKRVNPAKVFDNNFKAPFIYNGLADNFKSIETEKFTLIFDHSERRKMASEEQLAALEKNGSRVVGLTLSKQPMIVDKHNIFSVLGKDGELKVIGDIYDTLGFDAAKAPVDFCEVNIFSKTVPVAFVLGYTLGFNNLLKLLQVKYRIVEGRQNKNLASHEFAVQFKDYSYIFSRKDTVNASILAGFNEFDKQLKQYELAEFNKKDVYLNLLETKGLSSIYLREMNLMQQLFVDPITRGILEQMKEPITFNGLLIRSAEMLQTYHHPDSQDMSCMRVRGYERIPGAVYKQMVIAIRQYRNKNIAGKSKIDISPYEVWSSIIKDPAMKLVEDINPIQNLKESEIVTYAGEGGRGKDSMNKASRAYHENDMGIVSEATVDSSDVGVNAYLSANPQFKDLRGLPQTEKTPIAPSSLISTSALLAPGSDSDDIKRVNFVSIQQGHTIAAAGYHQPVVRTGYEYVIPNRTTDVFAFSAKQDGKVVSVTDSGITVEYKDGTRKGVNLGRIYGKAEGSIYPHDIVTDLKVGQKFTKGTTIAYNSGFFEKDFLDPSKVVLKNSRLTKIALMESAQTHEDSCAISPTLSNELKAKTTKVKSFVINFQQNLINVVKPGQTLNPKSILMIIEDEITSGSGAFDEESLQALKRLSNQAPKASYLGTLDKIEVFYNGEKSDMSSGLRALADRSDKQMLDACRSSSKPEVNGLVNADYAVAGTPLTMDKAEVRFYITVENGTGTGDKVVAANQMKSVIGEVLDYSVTTEDGTPIEMIFGTRSIMARIVTSPFVIGTTATLLDVVAKKASAIYRS